MEKYRIVSRNRKKKTILLESATGDTVVVNEGAFKDAFVKLKDAFLTFVKRGNNILVRIGEKVVNSVNSIYNVLLHKQKFSYIYLNDKSVDVANKIGVGDMNDEFDEFVAKRQEKDNINSAREVLQGLIYQATVCLKEINGADNGRTKVEEAYNPDYKLNYNTYRKMYKGASSEAYPERDEEGKEIKYSGFQRGIDGSKNFTKMEYPELKIDSESDIVTCTIDEVIDKLDRRASKIFRQEWDGDINNNPRDNAIYKPYVIYGASGIGKTSIIHQLRTKYGVNMVVLSGNYMNEYSLTSPTTSEIHNYRKGEDGMYVLDSEGKPVDLSSRTGVETVLSTAIPGMDIKKTEAEAIRAYSKIKEPKNTLEEFITERMIECDKTLGKGIIFIDEITRMPNGLLDSLMNLFDTGKVGNQRIGTNWMVVGALNPAFKKGEELIKANLSSLQEYSRSRRIRRINFIPTFDSFISYGKSLRRNGKPNLHPLVIKFLDDSTRMYHMMNVFYEVPGVEYRGNISNPALWKDLSDIMYEIDEEYNENGELSRDIQTLKNYIEEILSEVREEMPYEEPDMEEYLNSELLGLSDEYCERAWDRQIGTDVLDSNGDVLKNSNINNGIGITLTNSEIANKLLFNAPFMKDGKSDVTMFEKNKKNYVLNVFKFIRTFFGNSNSRSASVVRILLCDLLPKALYGKTAALSDIIDTDDSDYEELNTFVTNSIKNSK